VGLAERRRADADSAENGELLKQQIVRHQPQRKAEQAADKSPQREIDEHLLNWLRSVIHSIDEWDEHFRKTIGDDIILIDAEELRSLLRTLRADTNAFLLDRDSYLAKSRIDSYTGLRSDRNPVDAEWNKVYSVLQPYCRLLDFMRDHPNSGTDDPIKMREYFRSTQEDSEIIRQAFHSYGVRLRALAEAVRGLYGTK